MFIGQIEKCGVSLLTTNCFHQSKLPQLHLAKHSLWLPWISTELFPICNFLSQTTESAVGRHRLSCFPCWIILNSQHNSKGTHTRWNVDMPEMVKSSYKKREERNGRRKHASNSSASPLSLVYNANRDQHLNNTSTFQFCSHLLSHHHHTLILMPKESVGKRAHHHQIFSKNKPAFMSFTATWKWLSPWASQSLCLTFMLA